MTAAEEAGGASDKPDPKGAQIEAKARETDRAAEPQTPPSKGARAAGVAKKRPATALAASAPATRVRT